MKYLIRSSLLFATFLLTSTVTLSAQWPDMELLRAIRYGDQATALRLLESVPDNRINHPASSSDGNTLLHLAVSSAGRDKKEHSTAIIEKLLSMGADVNRINNKGQNPIFYAFSLRDAEIPILELLVAKGADINKRDLQGDTPLHLYVTYANVDVIEKAITLGANVNAANKLGVTPLMNSAKKGQLQVVQALLGSGADIQAKDKSKATALHYSAQNGDISVIDFFIHKGLHIDAKTAQGKTILSILAERRKWSVVRILLEKGANPNVPMRNGPTVAYYLVTHPELDMTKLVDTSKIDVNMKPEHGVTPLFNAINRVDMEQLELLASLGVDVNQTHAPNYPAIPFIAEKDPRKHKDAVVMLQRLIELGADIEARKMGSGYTGLAIAIKHGHEEMIDILIQSGAKVDNFAIIHLISNKRYALADRLLKNTPYLDWTEYRLWSQLKEVVREIEQAGGDHATEPQAKFLTALFAHNPRVDLRTPNGQSIEKIIQQFEDSSSVVVLNAITKATFIRRSLSRSQAGASYGYSRPGNSQNIPLPPVTVPKRTYSSDASLHVIGVYEGVASDNKNTSPWWASCISRSPGELSQKDFLVCHAQQANNQQEREVEIVVTTQEHPVVLALMAYGQTHWVVKANPGVKIEGIILAGYHGQRVSGISAIIPVDVYTYEHSNCEKCQVGDGYFYAYKRNDANFNNAMSRLKAITNLAPASFQGRYKGASFAVIDTN